MYYSYSVNPPPPIGLSTVVHGTFVHSTLELEYTIIAMYIDESYLSFLLEFIFRVLEVVVSPDFSFGLLFLGRI